MRVKARFRRVRDLFRRARNKAKSKYSIGKSALVPVREISREEMQTTQDNQDTSAFFARLPLEIRQQIYREVWKKYLKPVRMVPSNPGTDLRIHLYTDDSSASVKTFRHTRCHVHPCDPHHEDTLYASTPWLHDLDINPDHPAPGWFWYAWVLRVHWGKHWKCQHVVQRRWDPRTGTTKDAPKSPFLPVFLTCKRMYSEAITSFFANVTPIFTCSKDAQRFFMDKPHPYLSAVRCVELSLANNNDNLYLSNIWRDPACRHHRLAQPHELSEEDDEPTTIVAHRPETRILGKALWEKLILGMRENTPNLKDMEVCIAGCIKRHEVLSPFGYDATEEELRDSDIMDRSGESSRAIKQADEEPETPWVPLGKVVITFRNNKTVYMQQDGKMKLQNDVDGARAGQE
ncbi:hypothetical protein QBC44DRAFT_329739 [Cladorrhinum sp. PSN332]|nr:hypothetical protein QBC44DRAFT_329739 [Cladorrhinum sp. PSN332]